MWKWRLEHSSLRNWTKSRKCNIILNTFDIEVVVTKLHLIKSKVALTYTIDYFILEFKAVYFGDSWSNTCRSHASGYECPSQREFPLCSFPFVLVTWYILHFKTALPVHLLLCTSTYRSHDTFHPSKTQHTSKTTPANTQRSTSQIHSLCYPWIDLPRHLPHGTKTGSCGRVRWLFSSRRAVLRKQL